MDNKPDKKLTKEQREEIAHFSRSLRDQDFDTIYKIVSDLGPKINELDTEKLKAFMAAYAALYDLGELSHRHPQIIHRYLTDKQVKKAEQQVGLLAGVEKEGGRSYLGIFDKKVTHFGPQELMELNPYGTVPTLIDRDLVLYRSQIVMEYLDERFPHPPLLPVYPVARAKSRLMIARIDKDWYSLVEKIQGGDATVAQIARKQLAESLLAVAPLFSNSRYFLNEEYSLIDCCITPILWRLTSLGITLPSAKGKGILAYGERMFERQAFQASLTEVERELGEQWVS